MEGLAKLLGFEWIVNESGHGCDEFVWGTEFDYISQEDLDYISRMIKGKYSGIFKLSRELHALIKELEQEKNDDKRKKLEADKKKIEKEQSTFSVSVDELLVDRKTFPAALARASIGGLEVLVPVNRSEAPYGLLPMTTKSLRPDGPFNKQQIFDLAANRDLVFSQFAAPYERKGEKGTLSFVELHLTHDRLHWTEGYTTRGRIERGYSSREIANVTLVYQFDVRYGKKEAHFNVPTAETSIEVSFHGKDRGVTHTYTCFLVHEPDDARPYKLRRAVSIRNTRGGLKNDLLRVTRMGWSENAEKVKEFVAAVAETVRLVPHQEALEAQIKGIAATYRDHFSGELREFEHQGLKLGPEGYLAQKQGLFRRLFGF